MGILVNIDSSAYPFPEQSGENPPLFEQPGITGSRKVIVMTVSRPCFPRRPICRNATLDPRKSPWGPEPGFSGLPDPLTAEQNRCP
jgi:hypothetical protein